MSADPTDSNEERGFLDAASGVTPTSAVAAALSAGYLSAAADPNRRYSSADHSRRVLAESRNSLARTCGVQSDQVDFVPADHSHSVEIYLRNFLSAWREGSVTIISSPVESLAVLEAIDRVVAAPPVGLSLTVEMLPVDSFGAVQVPAEVGARRTIYCLQSSNGELGTCQDLSWLPPQAPLVTDEQFSFPLNPPLHRPKTVGLLNPSLWGGPGGCTVAIRGAGLAAPPLGLVPVPLAAANVIALELVDVAKWRDQSLALTDGLREGLGQISDSVCLSPVPSLPHILMFSFLYVAADELVDELNRRGWQVASGSLCATDQQRPLHVLTAIGALTQGNLRISVPPDSQCSGRLLADDMAAVVSQIRTDLGAAGL